MYSIIYSCHGYLFYCVIIHYYYLLLCSNFPSSGHWEIFKVVSCILFTCPHPAAFFFFKLISSTFLHSSLKRCPSYIFPAPHLENWLEKMCIHIRIYVYTYICTLIHTNTAVSISTSLLMYMYILKVMS